MDNTPLQIPSGQRLDRRFHNPDLYPQIEIVRPRFQDLDTLGHVNNTAMAAMYEQARVQFNRPMREHFRDDDVRIMVGGLLCNYVAEAHLYPDIHFHIGVGKIGTSSWTLQTVAFQADKPVFAGLTTMVFTRGSGSVPIPDALRDSLAERRITLPEGV